ncbi:MAG: hypothetical protein M1828_002371 [Chrysothrix sp. TS-e1954]|nr:MAG: hypothetical protein M1828_002371 [Chrysothrix sp. TS-e1954]
MRPLGCGWKPFSLLLCGTAWASSSVASNLTTKHEAGRCAIRGHCGKPNPFSGELPCADNGLAEKPDDGLREKITQTCGDQWADGSVCCTKEQVEALGNNLRRADSIIASCPACRENFYNLFCQFTCSPDQSLFVNVTGTSEKNDKTLVTELDNLWSDNYGSDFYDSCKEVKFGPTNSRAMNLIGGNAKNYTQFLAFLGKKQPLVGSPFQINFPRPKKESFPSMSPKDDTAYPCNSTDPKYHCACVDCPGSCAELPELSKASTCHVGAWPCLSFAVVLIYAICLVLLITAVSGHIWYRVKKQNKSERLRLLQDTTISDDEDEEDDIMYQPSTLNKHRRKYYLNILTHRLFSRLGLTCARFPAITIVATFAIVIILSLGWLRFEVETDPVRLWVAPDSDAAEEKAFFDDNFGPFYRTEQVFLKNTSSDSSEHPILTYDTLKWWFDVESRVQRFKSDQHAVTLEDVCFNPTGNGCVTQTLTGYWQGDASMLDPDDWQEHLEECLEYPAGDGCRPDSGQPLDRKLLLGGGNGSALDSQALIVTWVINNAADDTTIVERAMDWENGLKNLLLSIVYEAGERGLSLSFNTEVSLEQELNKSTNTDAKIVVVSYIIMFLYASLALGSTTLAARQILRNPAIALVESKFSLGVVGIVIVLMSVSASVGLFSALGIKVTLIIAEVIPFLVLAVGVDNIFLIVHEFERVNQSHSDEPVEDRIARALGRMGPSILLSATTETVAFALGTAVGMPAVRNFAAYAAGAVVVNAVLQVTMFVSFLALNQRRVEANRVDCFPCARLPRSHTQGAMHSFDPPFVPDSDASLSRFIRRSYAPALLGKKAKTVVTVVFLGLFAAGLALIPTIPLGLDQRIAIPSSSYLIDYFNDLSTYFNAGPPVYFVTRELNITQREHQQQLCGRFSTCDQFSLSNILEQERKRPEVSYIADATASWVDDFFLWLNPFLDQCCVDPKTGDACFADRSPPWNITLAGMPEGEEYLTYLRRFLKSPTDELCPLGGLASYSTAVVTPPEDPNAPITVPASHFRTSHTPLRTQDDFIQAYASARRIASDISSRNDDIKVFPYSKFYIFFDQYPTIVSLTITLLAAAIIACLLVSSLLLGSVRTGAALALTVTMILVDVGGCMALFGVSLNALTLVNLVICVGLGMEFCAHIARAFMFPSSSAFPTSNNINNIANGTNGSSSTRLPYDASTPFRILLSTSTTTPTRASTPGLARDGDARAASALTSIGPSVFSGIFLTKLLGVAVLAFTRSKIFEIYYFRVWVSLVVLGGLHALVFLPVLLSWVGGEAWDGAAEDGVGGSGGGGFEEDLRRRRVRGEMGDEEASDEDEEGGYRD